MIDLADDYDLWGYPYKVILKVKFAIIKTRVFHKVCVAERLTGMLVPQQK